MSKRNKSDRRRSERKEKQRHTKQQQESLRREQSKKRDEPRLRLAKEPPGGSESLLTPPSRMSMERTMRELHQALESQEFASEDDLHAFMAEINARGGSPLPSAGRARTASEKAQELAYEAMESDNINTAVELAMQAVELDRRCLDALIILAHAGSDSREEGIEKLEKIVRMGKQALGEDFFEENAGRFWGILETRSYMRARQELADLLRDAGRTDEAIGHYETMLDLNPNDNQGIRDLLLACYLTRDDLDGARRLFDQYEEDGSATFQWSRVLERAPRRGRGKGCEAAGQGEEGQRLRRAVPDREEAGNVSAAGLLLARRRVRGQVCSGEPAPGVEGASGVRGLVKGTSVNDRTTCNPADDVRLTQTAVKPRLHHAIGVFLIVKWNLLCISA